jgi:hypothetical protein
VTAAIDPTSIGHRVRCMVTQVGRVIRCPDCGITTFEDFRFDSRRDPLPGMHNLVDPRRMDDIDVLMGALTDMTPVIQRTCLGCGMDDN